MIWTRRCGFLCLVASPMRGLALSLAILSFVAIVPASPLHAQGMGSIQGTVRDRDTIVSLDYANIVLSRVSDGAQWGAMSLAGGRFYLNGIPAGDYVLRVLYLGYKTVEQPVTVIEGRVLELSFDLEITIVIEFPAKEISGQAIMVEAKDPDTVYRIDAGDLEHFAVDSVEDAVARHAGVTLQGGELHVRGGRGNELSHRVDGVEVNDPLGGEALEVGNLAVANVQTIIGGQDPEYGNALSGVVDVTTKEGNPDRFELQLRYITDDFGRQDRSFTNYDRFQFGLGGPVPIPRLTYFLSGDLRFTDQENTSHANRPETRVQLFGHELFKFRRRQFNDVKGSLKLAYAFDREGGKKLTAELSSSYSRWETYLPNWDVQGYAQTLVRMPRLESTGGGLEFNGRYDTFFYGPWVERLATLASTRSVRVSAANSRRSVPMPVLELRNTRGEKSMVIAEPAFIGARNDRGLFQTEIDPSDSAFVAFNGADHAPQNRRFSNQMKLVWRQVLPDRTFYTLKLSRVSFDSNQTVDDEKSPFAFLHGGIDSPAPFGGQTRHYSASQDYYTDPDHPLFVTDGSDWPLYNDEHSSQYNLRFDLTSSRYDGHKLKGGLRVVYNDLERNALVSPAVTARNRFTGLYQQGAARNQFHSFNPEASFYLQDRWEYEGMVLSGGFRWDMFSPGSENQIEIDNEELNRNVSRYKHQLSPRLGFAFPITERDGFSFHYGRFVQFPGRDVLFASQSTVGNAGTLGNPNLDAQTTIQYQASIKHQFTDFVALQLAVYNRDIYGLISATQVTDEATGNTLARYINRAFGNARGLELTLDKRFDHRWQLRLAYSYAFADGVASSQEFGANPNGLKFLPNQELPLNWDQRNSLSMDLRIAEPTVWSSSLSLDYGSGLPWTPDIRFERRQDPLLENSRLLPATYNLRIQAERHLNLYGQHLVLYLQGLNLLNQDQVLTVQPGILPQPNNQVRNAGRAYLTETGKFGGAYLQDVDGDNRNEFVPLDDPRVFDQHRVFRLGMGWFL